LTEKKDEDPQVVHKCLEMIYYLLQDPKIKTLDNTLRTLLDELVMPSVRDLQTEVRMAAVRALGVLSLRSLEVAKPNLVLLFQVSRQDDFCRRNFVYNRDVWDSYRLDNLIRRIFAFGL